MHDLKILAKYGCTRERLRTIFTSTGPNKGVATVTTGADVGSSNGSSPQENLTTGGVRTVPYQGVNQSQGEPEFIDPLKPEDWEIRRRFEYRIRSRLLGGIATGINNTKPLQAVDVAWDSPPIQKETIPLMLWAQGKIKHDALCDHLCKTADPATVKKFVRKGPDGKMIVNIPRICDISINLVRSFVTRRHAALGALWDNQWPLLKYDPRGTDETAQLRADALTQRIDIMADDYNYRHFLSQCDRDKLLYCHSLIFPRCAWDRKTGVRWAADAVAGKRSDKTETYTIREGVDFVNPHPSRWFWDLGAALANINTDNGPTYLGYWDIIKYGMLRRAEYYNVDHIAASQGWIQLLQQQSWYLAQYFDPCVLQFPAGISASNDPALINDRIANIGLYTADMADNGVLVTQYFEKINPKLEGISSYDCEVWVRFTAAGDGTIVDAEFLPSIPACYGAINANDNRVANASLAMEMIPYQDMASNIVSTMIEQIRRSFTQLWVFNKDLLDAETVKQLTDNATNQEWWIDPKVLLISISEKAELLGAGGGLNLSAVCAQINVQLNNAVDQALKGLAQLLQLADRLTNSSPNELGQPNPREVAAREVQEISTSVQSIYTFYNEGPREQRAALKKMLYESLLCCGDEQQSMPVLKRYQKKTIEAAGFVIVGDGKNEAADVLMPEMTRIMGNISGLNYTYYFDSREGAERAVNTQGAQVLQQFLVGLLQIPNVAQKLGPDRIFTMVNIIARMAGAPDEFQVELNDGEADALPQDQPEGQMPPQVQQALQQVMQGMQQLAMKEAATDQVVSQIAQKLGIPMPQPQGQPQPGPQAGPPAGGPPAPGTAPAAPAPAPAPGQARNGAAILQNPQ